VDGGACRGESRRERSGVGRATVAGRAVVQQRDLVARRRQFLRRRSVGRRVVGSG